MALSSSLPWLLQKPSSSSQILQRMKLLAAGDPSRSFTTCEGSRPTIVHKRSLDILHDPWFNKGTAFSMTERDRLDLRGLLPPNHMTPQQQIERFSMPFDTFFYVLCSSRKSVLVENIEEYAPKVYTPTVGLVCQNYSGLFRKPHGMYFSVAHRGEMMSMVYNWPADQVDMIVVTDGSRLLGLGDLGVQGIGIAIGKLDLYVATAGINPQRVLPVMIDVGTNNEKLLCDPLYLGLQEHHLDGEDYISVIDEFMEAVFTRWPHVIVQFEDFQSKWAFKLLQRYRNNYRMFNDDVQVNIKQVHHFKHSCLPHKSNNVKVLIEHDPTVRALWLHEDFVSMQLHGESIVASQLQVKCFVTSQLCGEGFLGTAGVAIAGLLGAVRSQGRPMIDFPKQKIVVAGVGRSLIIFGLVTESCANIDPEALPFARKLKELERQGLHEGSNLAEVVKKVKPDVLLGLSAVGGLFSKEVLESFKESSSTRPAIFAMSNPTKNAECTPEEAFLIVGDHIVFASGSPFPDVNLGNGIGHCNQGNNMYLFPGIGLGTLLSGARVISDGMLQAAAERLAVYMKDDEVLNGIIYPSISRFGRQDELLEEVVIEGGEMVDNFEEETFISSLVYDGCSIRDITKEVAAAVVREAVAEDLAEGYREMDPRELQKLTPEETMAYVKKNMWDPAYPTVVYRKE
ncbi:hypothetical protein ZIOFF_014160 [Zingiber officinale]|uniref:Malic enzyme n=1 Tax=Zingiber officinale TaxID=94328 RepID=A0A8J5HSU3_ZINOF|nr:hypothetical protein ZIOFF_014160 [Zingiber officinale]